VQEAFGIVIVAVVVVATIVALITFMGTGKLYEQIGRGGLSLNEDLEGARRAPASGGAVAARERDEEIRQFLVAKNERRARAGQEPLDIEAELARLNAPAVDEGLRAEIRQLVIARNERRARAGQEPLDVDAEVERQVRELG
jgi:hypothetical protein